MDAVPAWKRHLPAALFAAALAALAIALARPQATVAVPIEQASVLLVTDVSGSMQARPTWSPRRLDAARKAALDFLEGVPDEVRVGAVAYSTVPHTLDRPGTDRSAVVELMENLSADGGTATGDALAQALELLGTREAGKRPPAAIVLLSDGETTSGRDPVEVAREARRARVPIYTVALGTSEGVIETPRRAAARAARPRDDARDRARVRRARLHRRGRAAARPGLQGARLARSAAGASRARSPPASRPAGWCCCSAPRAWPCAGREAPVSMLRDDDQALDRRPAA